MYQNQFQFYSGELLNKTHPELKSFVVDFVVDFSNTDKVDREAFLKRMQDDDIYVLARTPIRFAATRAAWATPTLLINNADDVHVNHKSDLRGINLNNFIL